MKQNMYIVEPGAGIRLILEYEVKSPVIKLIMYLYLYMTIQSPVSPPMETFGC